MISDLNKSEKEINPLENKDVETIDLYSRFKSCNSLNIRERKLLREFVFNEKKQDLATVKTKISLLEKDFKQI